MSRELNDLSEDFRPLVFEFLARCVEAGIPVMVLDTLRTEAEQLENIAKGVSWTMRSKHLDGLTRGALKPGSDAIDVCPYAVWNADGPDKLNWDPAHPTWTKIGAIGEKLGLKWGGRFRPPAKPDYGHFERVM